MAMPDGLTAPPCIASASLCRFILVSCEFPRANAIAVDINAATAVVAAEHLEASIREDARDLIAAVVVVECSVVGFEFELEHLSLLSQALGYQVVRTSVVRPLRRLIGLLCGQAD